MLGPTFDLVYFESRCRSRGKAEPHDFSGRIPSLDRTYPTAYLAIVSIGSEKYIYICL